MILFTRKFTALATVATNITTLILASRRSFSLCRVRRPSLDLKLLDLLIRKIILLDSSILAQHPPSLCVR